MGLNLKFSNHLNSLTATNDDNQSVQSKRSWIRPDKIS